MIRRLTILLIAAITAGALVAGCGSSSSSGKATSSPASTSTASPTSSGASTASSGGAAAATPAGQAAVAACKQSFQAQPQLSASAKAKLTSLCDKAASGDKAAVKAATHDVCVQLATDIVPAGSARDAAVAACPK